MNETTQREISSTQSCKRPHDSGDPATGFFFTFWDHEIMGLSENGSHTWYTPRVVWCFSMFFVGKMKTNRIKVGGTPLSEKRMCSSTESTDISTVSTFPFHPHVPRPCLLPSSNMAVNWTASLNGQFQFNGKTIYNWRIVQRHVWLPECISFMCPVLFVKSSCGSVKIRNPFIQCLPSFSLVRTILGYARFETAPLHWTTSLRLRKHYLPIWKSFPAWKQVLWPKFKKDREKNQFTIHCYLGRILGG